MRVALLLALLVAVAGCVQAPVFQQPVTGAEEGRLVLGITDKVLGLESVTSVRLTVSSVAVHRVDTGAWVTLSSQTRTYDLIELNQQSAVKLLADATLEKGTYNQIRLSISSVEVTANGTAQAAVLPSSELKIPIEIVVEENDTSTVVLDFQLDRSLHTTGEGRVVMAPVIALRSSADVDVSVDATGSLRISGGRTVTEATVGTDVDGNVGAGLGIDLQATLSIGAGGKISVGVLGGQQGSQQSQQQTQQAVTYTVRADDDGFYDTRGMPITTLQIKRGTKAKIRFNVTDEVYFGGLDFRSSEFNSPKVEPNSLWVSPEFTMDAEFIVTSYWPASNVKKADLRVVPGN